MRFTLIPILVISLCATAALLMWTPPADAVEYGFRHDPMKWVENDTSLPGALARTFVFERPKEGDQRSLALTRSARTNTPSRWGRIAGSRRVAAAPTPTLTTRAATRTLQPRWPIRGSFSSR